MHKTECDKCERKSKCSPFNKSIGLDCKDFKNKSKEKEKKQMELKIKEIMIPDSIEFNYQELKRELEDKVSVYTNLVYTDENIKDAKNDRANLNKLKKALNDERIRREKEYMQPFNDFKSKINEIIGIIDKPVAVIDKQVKEFEEKQKQEKRKDINELFATIGFQPFVTLEMIFDEKWLNTSVSLKKIEEQMKEMMFSIGKDISTLSNLSEFSFEATEVYKSSLDINRAINEAQRMAQIARAKAEREEAIRKAEEEQRAKAEAEAEAEDESRKQEEFIPPVVDEEFDAKAFATGGVIEGNTDAVPEVGEAIVPVKEPVKEWVSFKCLLTEEDAQALGQFFRSRNIQFEQI